MSRRQLVIISVSLVLFLLLLPPPPHERLNAQEPTPAPTASPSLPGVQPDMAYQPPVDADELADFLPPNGTFIVAPPLTTTLPLTASIPIPTVQPLTPTLPLTATTAVTLTGVMTQLVSFAAGQIAVVFEEDTLTGTAEIQLTVPPFTATLPLTVTNTVSNPVDNVILHRFQLEVVQDGALISGDFNRPVRLVVDLRPLMQALDADFQTWHYYLAYQDETNPDIWIEVPVDVYQADGLLGAEVMHFSNWAAGVRPERWNPSWTPPTVSAFSGAATYNYPIEVPPGRRGMQPAVTLSYSSRGLDGRIRDGESGPIGDGWSIADISVVRVGVKMSDDGNTPRTIHPDKFRLVFNGSGHELFPAAGANTTTDATVRYHVKDAPGYYVERNYSASTPNTDGIYWILVTPDDTRYRLGYTNDAEEWQHVSAGVHIEVHGHTGHDQAGEEYSGIAWHVDAVTDAFGNQMAYDYHTRNHAETMQYWNGTSWQSFAMTTRANRIQTIKYNYPTRVLSLPASDTVPRLTSTPGTRIEFRPANTINGDTQFLINSIFIYHGGGSLPASEYRINSSGVYADSVSCINYDVVPNVPRQSYTRVVNSIQRFVGTDGDATTSDTGYALPATTFYYGDDLNDPNDYDPLPHFHKNSQPCFQFLYLRGYKNGYGGTVSFTYSHDNRSVGVYQYITYNQYNWPDFGYTYSVSSVRANDGRNPDLLTTYAYTQACYGQWNIATLPGGAVGCATPDAPEFGPITGYATTTQTHYDYNGTTVLNKQVTTFSQNAATTLGRPTQIEVKNAAGTLLTLTNHTYASESINGLANMFTYTSQTVNTQYNSGAGSTALSTKTTYEYNTAYQGSGQHGNLTHVREYDDAAAGTPFRTTVRWYYPRADVNGSQLLTGRWLAGTMGQESVYKGNQTELLRGTWYYYDGSDSPAGPGNLPTQAALTRSRNFIAIACAEVPAPGPGTGCAYARQTIDTTYGYDAGGFGNQTSITTYGGYGYRTFNSSWGQVYNAFASGARATNIAYESGYNLYPISVSNPLGQVTAFQTYGFNGVAVSGFQKQPGLLKQVTGADGVTTKYEYDPFGRLYAVYDGYSFSGFDDTDPGNGDPVTRYYYWDNNWNSSVSYLNPAGNAPFVISAVQRPGSFPLPTSSGSGFGFADETYYDGFGRPIQARSVYHQVEGQANTREIISLTAYDAQGQVSCRSVPYDVAYYADRGKVWPQSPFVSDSCTGKANTGTTYDALGRPLAVTAPDGTATTYTYNVINTVTVDGRNLLALTNIQDANNHITSQFTNSLGQLALVQEVSGTNPYTAYADTRYYYNAAGNLVQVKQSNPSNPDPTTWLARTTMSYDGFGRKTVMNDPDMGAWSYTYSAASSLTQQVDANGDRLCFEYDTLNRPTIKRTDSNGDGCDSADPQLSRTMYYTSGTGKVGKPSEIRWGSSSSQNRETFDYDTLGRLITHNRWVDNRQYTMSYAGFDAFHRPTVTTYPNGQSATVTYDREGANTLTNSGTGLISGIGYNARGQMTFLDRTSGGIDTTYLYHPQNDAGGGGLGDSNFRLKTIQHGAAGTGNAWPDFTYEYDDVGNITKMTTLSTAGTDAQTFTYDHLNRLINAFGSGVSPTYNDTYVYDKLGNITSFDGNAYTYTSGHVHAVTATAAGVSYSYDANGNMTLRDAAGTANDFSHSFNVENELITVANNGSTNYFSYDAAGLRVKSAVGRQVTYFPFPGYEETLLNSSQSWHLNEGSGSTAGDSSSHNFDGIIQGATWTTGIAGQALDFDGVNDRVEFNGSVHNEGAFTISAWLRPEQAPTGLGRLVAGTYAWNSDPARIKGWYFGSTYGSTDHFTFGLYDDEGNQAQAAVNNFFSQYLNQWVHVAGVFKPGQSLTLYINGQPVASDTSAVPDKVSLTNLFKIGARADNTTQGFWDGKMDAVQLFGYDLTTTEIQALANKNFNGVPAESSTVRLTFAIAGQAVALKVMGAGTATYYLYTDHLGSTGAMSTTGGGAVSGSTARYYPFGSWRTEPTAAGPDGIPLTDRGFTGHLHNNLGSGAGDIGLIYMGARWYMPGLGRFISADTIVPDPGNPQSYNRYSYVRNSPLNFSDPTGHRECEFDTGNCEVGDPYKPPPSPSSQTVPEPPSNLITHLPLDNITWTGGFGPNWYSQDPEGCNQQCYGQSHNIHTGLDLGGNAGDTVYATVSGEIVELIEYAGDADPNVVIKISVGNITYYVVHGHVVIDEAINARLRAGEKVEVTAGVSIGTLDDGPDYPHVHLGIRQKTEGQDRAWNPLLYMDSDLTVGMSFVSEDHPYYGNESPTSIRSFLYGTGSYFDEENQGSMGIIR